MTLRSKISAALLILSVCSNFIQVSAFAERKNSRNSSSRDSGTHRSVDSSGSTKSQGQLSVRIMKDPKTSRLYHFSQPETRTSPSGNTVTQQHYRSTGQAGELKAMGTVKQSTSGSYRINHYESDGTVYKEKFDSKTGTTVTRESRARSGQK